MTETQQKQKTKKEEYTELVNKYAEIFRKKDNEQLYQAFKNSNASDLTDRQYLKGLGKLFENCRPDIEAFYEEINELKEERGSPYHEYTNSDGAFKPSKLGKDIERAYNFKCLKDSGQLLVYKNGWWQPQAEQLIKEEVNLRLGEEFSKKRMKETISWIKTSNYVKRKNFQPPKKKINFKNCVYDLEKGDTIPHEPGYNFTFQVPWNYNPDAEPDKIDDFLDEVTYNQEDKIKLYELAAYTLIPSYPFNKAGMLSGNGNNGKTIYIDILKRLTGEENYADKKLQELKDGFDTHFLYGKLACFDDDLPPTKLRNTDIFKKLTGGSDIGAEVKFGDQYNFNPFAKFIFAANKIPPTTDKSAGFYRRWMIVDFPYKFIENPPEDNERFKEAQPRQELMNQIGSTEEMEGLVKKCVNRLEIMIEQNGFTYSNNVEQNRKKWREHSVPLVSFIERFCEQGKNRNEEAKEKERKEEADWESWTFDYVRKDNLHRMISAWCKKHGEGPPSKKALTQALKDSDIWVGNTQTNREPDSSKVRVYSGLKIVLEKEDDRTPSFLFDLIRDDSNQSIKVVESVKDRKLNSRVKDYMSNNYSSDMIGIEDLRDELIDEDVIDEGEDFDGSIEFLLSDGSLFEPNPGYVQYL